MHPEQFIKELNLTLGNKLDESASVIVDNAKSEAPVASGALKESIRKAVDKDALNAEVGSDLNYALNIELGTKNIPPNPYLRRGLSKSISAIKAIFGKK
jgi:HK97 gp10 family phage protein